MTTNPNDLSIRIEALMEADKLRTQGNWRKDAAIGGLENSMPRIDACTYGETPSDMGFMPLYSHDWKTTIKWLNEEDLEFICLSSKTPQLVRDLLRVIAMQEQALSYARPLAKTVRVPVVDEMVDAALLTSAPLVETAKKLEVLPC